MTEGNLGALIMVVAGIGTIIASAFGAFRAATSLLAVAVGAFVLRSFVEIFFDADLNLGGECNLSAVNTERGGNGN
jgi:divalent metal cation (Fe/Co/Zn/Cd) transporter